MDYDNVISDDGNIILRGMRQFDLANTLDSGQCFRWRETAPGEWSGVAHRCVLTISRYGPDIVLHNMSMNEFEAVWKGYFDIGRDYTELEQLFRQHPAISMALDFAPGIRVLRQEPFETLCSFILSQNNNVKRIKGLMQRLCEYFGDEIGTGFYAFPTPEALAGLTVDDLAPVRCGFRAKYLLDAARLISSGKLLLNPLYTVPLDDARRELRRVYGVGEKVADCVLLYAFARTECVPMDVWMKRVMPRYFPSGFPSELAPWAGIAQQTLFHYARSSENALLFA